MFKTVALAGVLLTCALVSTQGYAQTTKPATEQKTTIFDYKKELKLTDEQEQKIRQLLLDLSKQLQIEQAKLTLANAELEELLKKEAELEKIKEVVNREATIRAAITYADLAAGRQINAVLTPAQLKQWRAIQEQARQAQRQSKSDPAR
ncbi:MAG: Spy/CpxP family protein refolding chaperone [Nitrospiraceae bacterium]